MNVLYHANCMDGLCAAWVVKQKYPGAKFLPVKYGEAYPLKFYETAIIVDFSYPREVMEKLTGLVVCLDHHKTAQEALGGLDKCVFDMDRSGAKLAWDWFGWEGSEPWFISYVQDRDLWRFKLEDSEIINIGLRVLVKEIDDFNNISILHVREVGKYVSRYRDQLIDEHCKRALPLLDGGCYVRCTVGEITSEIGDRLGDTYKYVIIHNVGFSLRSKKIDVSEIAKAHGGGGHFAAAGCPSYALEFV